MPPKDKTVGIPPFVNVAAIPRSSWDEEVVKVIPDDLRLMQSQIEHLTSGSPKLTGMDTVICWLKRRIQPVKENSDMMSTYSVTKTDPLRVSENDLTNDAFLYRFKRLVKDRKQFVESCPMFTAAKPPPSVSQNLAKRIFALCFDYALTSSQLTSLTDDKLAPLFYVPEPAAAAGKTRKRKPPWLRAQLLLLRRRRRPSPQM